jgi:glycosyltransferase involved in cell wall biosynthesis
MRIALSVRKFSPPLVGGVDVYAERLAQAFNRLGHEVFLIAFDSIEVGNHGRIETSQDEHNGSKVWRLKFAINQRPADAFQNAYDREMGQVIKEILEDEKPDLLIIMNFYLSTLALVEVAKELELPVVHIATDFLPVCRRATLIRWDGKICQTGESISSCASCFVSHHPLGRLAASTLGSLPERTLVRLARQNIHRRLPHPYRLLRPYWKQIQIMEKRLEKLMPLRHGVDLVVAPSRYTYNAFLENGFQPEQLLLLPFGVDLDNPLARVEHRPAPQIRFLFIGRLQPYKGAHLLVEAFDRLSPVHRATLTIYGTADGHQAYFDQMKSSAASNQRIQFAGRIAPSDLHRAFAEADYFMLPSLWHENTPLILLDALQSRTPVIASDVGGVNDLIQDGKNGFLFPMGDGEALQQVMQRVIDQPELISRLREGVKLISIDEYADTVLEKYTAKVKVNEVR